MLMAVRAQRPGMLLDRLKCTGQSPQQQQNIPPKTFSDKIEKLCIGLGNLFQRDILPFILTLVSVGETLQKFLEVLVLLWF